MVTILLAAVKKTATAQAGGDGAARVSTAPIWLGVLGAVTLSGAFAAVLTFSVSVLSSAGQEAVGGLLSVFAVGLVTAMIFWMRRTAATLSAHLRGEVARAAAIGTGALTITAFLSVGREGLETTLFLWTAAKASGQTVGPLVGAAIGIAAAVALCALLYRRAIHLNVGVFFSRTAFALIVIAAGVLAYGLGDLQDVQVIDRGVRVQDDVDAHVFSSSPALRSRARSLMTLAFAPGVALVMTISPTGGRQRICPDPVGVIVQLRFSAIRARAR